MRLTFDGLDRPVHVGGGALPLCAPLLSGLLPYWPHRADESPAADLDVVVAGAGAQVTVAAPCIGVVVETSADLAAFDVAAVLMRIVRERSDRLMGLHAAAVEAGRQAVLMVGPSLAGKTSLATRLVMAGQRLITDDSVLLRRGGPAGCEAVAFGAALKLRPLPEGSDAASRRFASERRVATVGETTICVPRPGESLAMGQSRPLGAVLLLDRRDGIATAFGAVRPSDAVRFLLGQLGAGHVLGRDVLDALLGVVRTVPVRRLSYSDSAAAAAAILAAMQGGLDAAA